MPESLSSFLVSVSVILAVILFVPGMESLVRLLRRKPLGQSAREEADKVFSREVA